jgi:2,4-dienoyl-CoA reductase-like NADH-dependent reductase (Old Yellow Enzyme family)
MPDGTYGIYPAPRALKTSEILELVEHYSQAALNAIRAGQYNVSFQCFGAFFISALWSFFHFIGHNYMLEEME